MPFKKHNYCYHTVRCAESVTDFFVGKNMLCTAIRGTGEFSGKAMRLNDNYDYAIGRDSEDMIILVPLKKKFDCCK